MVALASDGIYITVILISCQSSTENTREIVQDKSCGFAEVVVGSLRGEISNFPLCIYCFSLKGQKSYTILPSAKSNTSFFMNCAERVLPSCWNCWRGGSHMTPHPFPFHTRIKEGRVQKVAALHVGVRQGLPSQEAMPCSLRLHSLWHNKTQGGVQGFGKRTASGSPSSLKWEGFE